MKQTPRRMESILKEEILYGLCSGKGIHSKMADRIKYVIRGDLPSYIQCMHQELQEAYDETRLLKLRVQQLEKEKLLTQILIQKQIERWNRKLQT